VYESLLNGKTVRVKNVDLLCYLYPDYVIREKLSIMDRDSKVIYVGRLRPNLKEYLSKNTMGYINTTGAPDVDLTNKEGLLNFVYQKHGKKPPNTVKAWLEDVEWDEFIYYCKVIWILGGLKAQIEDEKSTMFNLFMESSGSTKELLTVLFSLYESIPMEILEAGYLTFLSRAADIEGQSVGANYLRALKGLRSRCGDTLKPSITSYIKMKKMRVDAKLLKLIFSLRGA